MAVITPFTEQTLHRRSLLNKYSYNKQEQELYSELEQQYRLKTQDTKRPGDLI